MNTLLRTAALAGLSILLLAGCQSAKSKAMCPAINVLANTSTFTKFKPGMDGDPAGELFRIEVLGAKGGCDFDIDEGTTDSNIDITFRATRPPSGESADFTAPYYVATLQDGTTMLAKKILATAFTFQPGETSVTFTDSVPSVPNRLQNGVKPYQYSLLVGFQLTREQLDYLKSPRHYAP
ncbi:MAG TPA: hypothetical protein VHZ78_15395 [Rhizomicrobium sp.]|jgi:hypothetical protein|nr:hypothetical protein [Rhizomicrobium sp.]